MFQTIMFALMFAALGIAMLFLGYRLFRILVPIWGFFAGFSAGAQVMSNILGTGFLATLTGWIVGFIIGIILGILAYAFYKLAIILLGASMGYSIGVGLMAALGLGTGFLATLVGLAIGAVFATSFFVLNIPKVMIYVYTAAAGAGAVLAAALLLLGRISLESLSSGAVGAVLSASWGWMLVWLLVSALGAYTQARTNLDYVLQPY